MVYVMGKTHSPQGFKDRDRKKYIYKIMKSKTFRVSRNYSILDILAKFSALLDAVFAYFTDSEYVTVEIKPELPSISEKQRKYYFGVVVAIVMDYHGMTKDQAHQHLKRSYLPEYEEILDQMIQCEDKGDMKNMLVKFLALYSDLTITTESTWKFERYLKDIRFDYSHHGVFIPLPNEEERWEGWEMMR